MKDILTDGRRVEPLTPEHCKRFFARGGTVYDAIDILWDKIQELIVITNHTLDVIDRHLAVNDLAAINAENAAAETRAMISGVVEQLEKQLGLKLDITIKDVESADSEIFESLDDFSNELDELNGLK